VAELSPESEALMLAYVYGELSESAASAFEEQLAGDPDLRAEVDGLLATRELLDMDVRYGEQSGLDEPPPHLREAIFRAEALARPAELRDASIQRAAPLQEPPPLLHRLSTWLLGGGLALGAAAAALVVVSTGDLRAPSPEAASTAVAADEEAPAQMAKRGKKREAKADNAVAADKAAAAPGAAPAEDAPTYEIDEVFGDTKASADEGEADGVAQRGLATAPSRGLRDDLDAPATITATKGDGRDVTVKVMEEPRRQSADARADPKPEPALEQPAPTDRYEKTERKRALSKDQAAPKPRADRPTKKVASRRSRSAGAGDNDAFGGPPALPPSVSSAKRESIALGGAAADNKRSKGAAAGRSKAKMMDMQSNLETNETLQAADEMMKRGRYDDAASLYLSAAQSRPANQRRGILARYIEACYRGKRDPDAIVGWRELDRLMKGRKVTGDIRAAYVFAGQSAQRMGNDELAATIFAKTRSRKSKK
jgi:hypothetical protein